MPSVETLQLPIVGAHFHPPAKSILAHLPIMTPLILRAEPSNPYDVNAIQVLIDCAELPSSTDLGLALGGYGTSIDRLQDEFAEVHLGYIPRHLAAALRAKDFPPIDLDLHPVDIPGWFTLSPTGAPCINFNRSKD